MPERIPQPADWHKLLGTGAYHQHASASFDSAVDVLGPFTWHPTGETLYFCGWSNDEIHQTDVSDPWDLGIASGGGASTQSLPSDAANPVDVGFSTDGTLLHVLSGDTGLLVQMPLSTAYDVTTADISNPDTKDTTSQDSRPSAFTWNDDGTDLFVVGSNNNVIQQYGGAHDDHYNIAAVNDDPLTTDSTSIAGAPTGIVWSPSGDRLFVIDNSNKRIRYWPQQHHFNINFDQPVGGSLSLPGGANIFILRFKPDGSRLYWANTSDTTIRQYNA